MPLSQHATGSLIWTACVNWLVHPVRAPPTLVLIYWPHSQLLPFKSLLTLANWTPPLFGHCFVCVVSLGRNTIPSCFGPNPIHSSKQESNIYPSPYCPSWKQSFPPPNSQNVARQNPTWSSSPYRGCRGDLFQDSQWMPETPADSTKTYIYCFFPIHTYLWQSLLYKLGTVRG